MATTSTPPTADRTVDVLIAGAGPVGLLSAFLLTKLGLNVLAIDKSSAPLELGRADAMNARTLQVLQILQSGIFEELYPQGLICNTSSVWKDGKFESRQSKWWNALVGCAHKNFLMLGQPYVEAILDRRLADLKNPVQRNTTISKIEFAQNETAVYSTLQREGKSDEVVKARYLIGADGSHSFIRKTLGIPFEGEGINMTWAVLDGEVDSTFPNVPEIINFQVDTSDVARIPREGNIQRYYVRMDEKREFTNEEAIAKIERAVAPHPFKFSRLEWASQFTVQERIAVKFVIEDRVFLAGDAGHVHSVNGGQGLNTGLMDAFNLAFKIYLHAKGLAGVEVLRSYEKERRPVAQTVIETAGKLVRATKYAAQIGLPAAADAATDSWNHAGEYVRLVELNSRFITGMGISYADSGSHALSASVIAPEPAPAFLYGTPIVGYRAFDFLLRAAGAEPKRLYSVLPYDGRFTVLVFENGSDAAVPAFVSALEGVDSPIFRLARVWRIGSGAAPVQSKLDVSVHEEVPVEGQVPALSLYKQSLGIAEDDHTPFFVVVRPDVYVGAAGPLSNVAPLVEYAQRLAA